LVAGIVLLIHEKFAGHPPLAVGEGWKKKKREKGGKGGETVYERGPPCSKTPQQEEKEKGKEREGGSGY